VTFGAVTASGFTRVISGVGGPAAPSGYELAGHYYEVATSANYTPPVIVSITYDDNGMTPEQEDTLELYHYEDTNGDGVGDCWVVRTLARDTAQNTISGRVMSLSPFALFTPAAEVTVLGNGVSITDGDVTPSAADGTSCGTVFQGAPPVSRTFTVRNDGTDVLILGAVTVPLGYTLTEDLSTSLPGGASDTFTVQLETASGGTKTGEVTFTTNDTDENPFHFRITGTVSQDGSLDPSFGGGTGKVTTPIGSSHESGTCVALQSDGRIVVAGGSATGGKL